MTREGLEKYRLQWKESQSVTAVQAMYDALFDEASSLLDRAEELERENSLLRAGAESPITVQHVARLEARVKELEEEQNEFSVWVKDEEDTLP